MTAPRATRTVCRPDRLRMPGGTQLAGSGPTSDGRRARPWRRRVLTAVATGSSLWLVALGVLGWYFAQRLARLDPVVETYPLRVVAVDTLAATVTLSHGQNAGEPGSFRLSWPSGRARVGPVVAENATTVTRSLTDVSGHLRAGQRVGIQSNPFTGDPLAALGLPFADVTVPGPTGALPAWYLAGRRQTWVLLIHGLAGSRADTLPAMPTINALGFPMLAITYRNDVGAAASHDDHSHLGDTEWHDVEAAIRYARANGAQGVVLYGWSLGGGMAVVASEESPERDVVRALVLDSPLLDWAATLDASFRRHDVPSVVARATRTMLTGLGVHLDRYDEPRLAAALSTPTLVVQGGADVVVPPAIADAFARARPDLVHYLRVAGADHVSAAGTDPDGYATALGRLLGSLP